MNVAELRDALAALPGDLMVVVRGYEEGVDEVGSIEQVAVALDVNEEWYYGDHGKIERPWDEERFAGKPQAAAIQLVGGRG